MHRSCTLRTPQQGWTSRKTFPRSGCSTSTRCSVCRRCPSRSNRTANTWSRSVRCTFANTSTQRQSTTWRLSGLGVPRSRGWFPNRLAPELMRSPRCSLPSTGLTVRISTSSRYWDSSLTPEGLSEDRGESSGRIGRNLDTWWPLQRNARCGVRTVTCSKPRQTSGRRRASARRPRGCLAPSKPARARACALGPRLVGSTQLSRIAAG